MTTFDWESFLRRWSQELLEQMEDTQGLPPEILDSGWLGYPGATETQIARVEAHLGIALPPSYREFLKITNGWRQTTPFIYKLWSTEELEWLSVRRQEWIDTFIKHHAKQQYIDNPRNGSNAHIKIPSIPDKDYLVYGDEQDCSKLRVEYLRTALEVSNKGDFSIYLLNPQIIAEDGEWEAWFFGDWLPGADRYRSFREMMQAEYLNFLELRDI